MKRELRRWEIVGFIATGLFGTLLHFVYEWTGGNRVIAVFSAVNESTWEHMKLLFIPFLVFTVVEFIVFSEAFRNFFAVKAASKGDPDAMKIVLQHFSGYIASLSMRKLYDERGNVYYGVDEDIRERLQARLMRAILTFRADE